MDESSDRPKFHKAIILVWLFGMLLTVSAAAGAGERGSITGTVTDPSGAVIPGVAVVISNPVALVEQTVSTDSEGNFSFPNLAPGSYQVEIRQSGFTPLLQTGLQVESSKVVALNLKLELGQQATTVTVTESSLHVEANDTATGETITAAKMASIPLNGRSFTDLLALQPGIVPASSRQPNAVVMSGCTTTSPSGDLNPGNLSISGQRETSNGFILNGSSGVCALI